MEHMKNTVGVYYKIKTGGTKAKLTLAPIVNFRDFHTVNTNNTFDIRQEIQDRKVKLVIDGNSQTPIYMNISEGEYKKHENDVFRNMFYIEEEKRGFLAEENHAVPGVYEIEIPAKTEKEISFICSLEENIEQLDVKWMMEKETERMQKIFDNSELLPSKTKLGLISNKTKPELTNKAKSELNTDEAKQDEELIKKYLIAADNFIAYRPSFSLHTIIAGYPWFLDWGRDSLIAFEGLLLVPKRFEIAREVLKTMIRDVKYGLVPNGYSGYDNRPLYNSVDASLLLFEQVQKYIDYTKDYDFIEEKIYKVLEGVIKNYSEGLNVGNNNIYLDTDGLIVSGTEETQNTWMDAKYNEKAVTPRNGKVVEVNSLWYNANKIMENLSKEFKNTKKTKMYKELAEKCKESFSKFYNKKTKCLEDVLGDSKIRPNQLFALSLTYPIIDPKSEEAKNMLKTVESKLLNNYGLKTLAKGEENYVEVYEGDVEKRDTSYHQGITWPWLLGLYYNALKNTIKATNTRKEKEQKHELEEKLEKFIQNTKKTFEKEIDQNGCIGSISELYDSKEPQLPKGAIAQAWSVAEVFRIILRK